MSGSVTLPADSIRLVPQRRQLLYVTWTVVLLLTIPEIILRAFLQVDTSWMLAARILLLAGMAVATVALPSLRPLRGFMLALLGILITEGWFFGTVVPQTQAYQTIFGSGSEVAFLGERLLRIGAVIVMFAVLLAMGLKPRQFYFAVGDLRAPAEPMAFKIPSKPEPWTVFGRNYVVIATAILLIFMVPAFQPSLSNLSAGLILFAALCAALNAFAEEFLYRSALIPQLLPLFGKHTVLLIVPAYFGLAHYFGVPNGITGVLITAIGGWFFAKSMIETGGMGWAWFMHFVADFIVYLILFGASVL
jgi:membrane protease YdiL (CAAX protease family)